MKPVRAERYSRQFKVNLYYAELIFLSPPSQTSPSPLCQLCLSANALTCTGYRGNTLLQAGDGVSCLQLQELEGPCKGLLGFGLDRPVQAACIFTSPKCKNYTPTLASASEFERIPKRESSSDKMGKLSTNSKLVLFPSTNGMVVSSFGQKHPLLKMQVLFCLRSEKV